MIARHLVVFATSTIALAASDAAYAQETPGASAAAATDTQDAQVPAAEIVVTGTRTAGRSRLDTASPVDVLSNAALTHQASTELGAALATVAPSIDFPRPSAVDGTDAIRPATLRGLSPDQTLVLINGVRAHTSALLNINSSVGRGAAAVDLNTIPGVALDTIEVLRDGASAQYGSDAIAGVINLRLRQARSGGAATVDYGLYDTDVDTARGSRHVSGEHTFNASAWQGIGFGSDGYITLSGEYQDRRPTNRADYDPRVTPTRVTGRFGDPEVHQYTGWVNAGTSITDDLKLYGWFGYQARNSESAAFPRLATAATAVSGIYPDGFLPLIHSSSRDLNSAIGIKGDVGGWTVDANISYGRNRLAYETRNSANYSLGNASPTSFKDGAMTYDQLVGGIDVSRKYDVFQSLNVAFGVEGRREGFKIAPGEEASYTGSGAQGFGGFSPLNVVDRHRENGSAYVDLEAQVTDKFLAGIAGRVEDYSDFGWTGNGKLSLRYDFTPNFALRGTASTGFRAPALQQQYFTSVASVIQNGSAPILTGTFPSTAPVAEALGGKPLQPEKSTNLSAGAVIRSGGFDLTIDAYRIHIRDQLGLSENIQAGFSPQVAALLAPFNVSAARFFINGLASTTRGLDVVGHYRWRAAAAGTFDFTVAGNLNDTKVTKIPTSTSTLNPAPTLFARSRILTLEDGTPATKVTGTIDWALSDFGATARVTYYGNVIVPGTNATTLVNGTPVSADIPTGRNAIADLELRYQPKKGVQLSIGASNLFDTYPKRTPTYLNTTGVVGFPYYSPFGFNGRYLYVRAGLRW